MSQTEPLIRNVSDTARWVAVYRARESSRPDALFHDLFAQRLAGERGEQIARAFPFGDKNAWPFSMRTYLFDQLIEEEIQRGADMIVNLAAGLDARPYRMALPSTLRWIEVDLPEILDYKEEILRPEKPRCELERVRLDLADRDRRRQLFAELGRTAGKALIITEGLITYLAEDEVGSLAQDLAAPPGFQRWVLDMSTPALIRMLQKRIGSQLSQAPFKFAPQEGPRFFERYGWKRVVVHSFFKTAAQKKRLPLFLRLMAWLPQPDEPQASRPWSGACLFTKP
jgi:methyltransferase (TIGR00027 family)